MTCRVYFRGRKKDKFVLITNCPGEYEAVCVALKKYGSAVDFVQDKKKPAPEGKFELLETLNFEQI